ncbi:MULTISPECIES: hypothetical protein [Brevibacterium]|nr:hypothetical protein [Brevibacterium sp. CS2]QCP05932.1 hypothetical protein FDF13_12110 [Brevibacterium sp. CS2]
MSAPYSSPSSEPHRSPAGEPMPADDRGISAPRTWRTAGLSEHPPAAAPAPVSSTHPPEREIRFVDFPGIEVTSTGVHTPAGTIPLDQARFFLADRTWTTRSTPGWAIALAIGGFFVVTFFSLLFLLAKDERTTGYVDVTVTGAGVSYTSSVPIASARARAEIHSRWAYAQQLAGRI